MTAGPAARARRRPHPAWGVAAVTFATLLAAGAFRSVPGTLIAPMSADLGWSVASISAAVSVNLVLYGLIAPFAAALMGRFGVQRVVTVALLLVAAGGAGSAVVEARWQLVATWGVLVGVGTGSMAMSLAATVVGRWFVARRGLVTGVLAAAASAGQLVFLPLVAHLAQAHGWRVPSLVVAAVALAVVPLVLLLLHERPADRGVAAYGAGPQTGSGPAPVTPARALTAFAALRLAVRHRAFWFLAAGFAICGATTNGLIGTHFVSAAHDHGMPATTAASLLALVGLFDVVGTIASGWLTDRVDARYLLLAYYALRGVSLLLLPSVLAPGVDPATWVFVVFYGLDWIATVPPTIALCREHFGDAGAVVFGWVFASHQLGAALAAFLAGAVRDATGDYAGAFLGAGALCLVAAALSLLVGRRADGAPPVTAPAPVGEPSAPVPR
ncbi:MFS transporter [Kineococcus sp. R8]|nr:MFS transporter [Kineococcus siccus]NAZ83621.1 MFS transporter [Kineococcus siccus]